MSGATHTLHVRHVEGLAEPMKPDEQKKARVGYANTPDFWRRLIMLVKARNVCGLSKTTAMIPISQFRSSRATWEYGRKVRHRQSSDGSSCELGVHAGINQQSLQEC